MQTQPDHPARSPVPLPVRLARAVLLFQRGVWTRKDITEWERLTGTHVVSTETLAYLAREVEGSAGELMAVARRQALLEAEAVAQRLDASDACIGAIVALREASHGNG